MAAGTAFHLGLITVGRFSWIVVVYLPALAPTGISWSPKRSAPGCSPGASIQGDSRLGDAGARGPFPATGAGTLAGVPL
jgi:hypothetical protein